MARYRVVVGINYGTPERRAEPGDLVDDLSASDAEWMLADGVVEKVTEPRPKKQVSGGPDVP